MAEFGFLIAAVLGASAGTTDLSEGMFRHLVITGRSRLALYLARIPAGLAILLPLVAVAFTALCLVTSYAGVPQPTSVSIGGVSVPEHFDQAELQTWLLQHPRQAATAFPGPARRPARRRSARRGQYRRRLHRLHIGRGRRLNPAVNEMTKIGLWITLEVGIGFMVGLGLGSLTGQRTLSTILLIGLEIIVTPILAHYGSPISWTASGSSWASRWISFAPPGWHRAPAAAPAAACCSAAGAPSAYLRCRPGR